MAFQMNFLVFLVLATVKQSISQEGEWPEIIKSLEPGCIMYDICYWYEDGKKALNCLTDDPDHPEDKIPKVLSTRENKTAIDKLRGICAETMDPYRIPGDEEQYHVCCHQDQVDELAKQISMAEGIIARCPSCWKNFRQVFCELTCSPYQVHFMRAAKIDDTADFMPPEEAKRPRMLREMELFYTEGYAQRTYDSCKDVMMGAANTPAMDFLCGSHGSLRCDPQKWFGYMGDFQNSFAPFHIYFTHPDDGESDEIGPITAFDGATYTCDVAYPGGDKPCSCVDCEGSCPAAPDLPEKTRITDWKILNLFGMYFIMIIVFVAVSVVIAGGAWLLWRSEKNREVTTS